MEVVAKQPNSTIARARLGAVPRAAQRVTALVDVRTAPAAPIVAQLTVTTAAKVLVVQGAIVAGTCPAERLMIQTKSIIINRVFKFSRFKEKCKLYHDLTEQRWVYVTLQTLIILKNMKINTSRSRGQLKLLKHLCKKNGWKQVFEGGTVMWSGLSVPVEELQIATEIKLNRIPEMTHLCHKRTSGYMLNKFYQYWPQDFGYLTQTFILPEEAEQLEAQLRTKRRFFIAKPSNGTQGDGIVLITSAKQIPTYPAKDYIVQPYIDNPLLLGGKKFDLRLYVLVARVQPFIALINQTGMVRICAEQYQKPSKQNIRIPYIHLTNYHLNKDHKDFVHSTELEGDGNKRVLHAVWKELSARGIDVDGMWKNIIEVVTGHLVAFYPFIKYYYNSAFPKKRGIDVLLDEEGKPYVLQLNANPSLKVQHETYDVKTGETKSEESPVDFFIKEQVVEDALRFIALKKAEQVAIPVGEQFRSYQVILNGVAQMEKFSVLSRLVSVFHFLTGSRVKSFLNNSQFCKLGRFAGLTSERFDKNDYTLLFIKTMRETANPNMMDYQHFLKACEILSERLCTGQMPDRLEQLVELLERNLPDLR